MDLPSGATDPNALAPARPEGASDVRAVPVPRWAELLTRLLDDAIGVPGTKLRFGLDGIIGLLFPGAGDAVTAISAGALLLLAIQRRVPTSVFVRMLLNIAIDAVVGAFPIVGDFFDFAYKSNRKNLELLRREGHLPSDGSVTHQAPDASPRGRLGDALLLGVGGLLLVLCIVLPLLVWLLIFGAIEG